MGLGIKAKNEPPGHVVGQSVKAMFATPEIVDSTLESSNIA